jgi:DNA-binding transcriptional ArsR family regulator
MKREEKLSEMLKALAHPTRLKILAGLLQDECNVAKIQRTLALPQSTISQHLRMLKDRGIIQARQEGTKRCYRVIDDRVKSIMQMLNDD